MTAVVKHANKQMLRVFCACIVYAYLFMFTGNLYAVPAGHDRSISDAYVSAYLESGYTYAGTSLLESALEFYPSHGDALYLMGRNPGIPVKSALEYLEKALTADYWHEYSKNDAGVYLFRMYNQLRRYSVADILLSQHDLDFFTQPDDALLLARYYHIINDSENYKRVVNRGYSRWYEHFAGLRITYDTDFRTVIMERMKRFPDFFPGISVLTGMLRVFPEETEESRLVLERYVSSDGFSALLHARAVSAQLLEQEELKKVLSFGHVIGDLAMERPEFQEVLDELYASYSGVINFDRDDDLFFEEILVFSDGRLVEQIHDPDQDGNADTRVIFSLSGLPDRVIRLTDESEWIVRYKEYPFVESITQNGPSSFLYVFDQAALPLIGDMQKPYFSLHIVEAGEADIITFCTEKNTGVIPLETESNGNILPSDKTPYSGTDGYAVTFSGSVRRETWDVDGDGEPDIIMETDSARNSKLLEMFGYTVRFINGVPDFISYMGKQRNLTVREGVAWIDTDPFAGTGNVNGFFYRNGRYYYAFHYGDYLFIQPVGVGHE